MKNKKKPHTQRIISPKPYTIYPQDYYRFFHPDTITKIWIQTGRPKRSYLPIRLYIDTKIREQKGIDR
jgi:hypothetical protein